MRWIVSPNGALPQEEQFFGGGRREHKDQDKETGFQGFDGGRGE